jgi:hypothetical protein
MTTRHTYHAAALAMKRDEPIEIRIDMRSGGPYHLIASTTDNGLIRYGLTVRGAGTPHALSNLQSPLGWPNKARGDWQVEVLAAAAAGLGTITEVR